VPNSLTLAQQKICGLSPTKIGISQGTLVTITSVWKEDWQETPQGGRSLNCTNICPFATRLCRFLKLDCPAVVAFNEVLEDDDEPDVDCGNVVVDQLDTTEEEPAPLVLLPLKYVSCLMSLDLASLPAPAPDKAEIVAALAKYQLACDPNPTWIPQRILTIRMQQLMKCSLSDIGVSIRDMEALENHVNPPITKLADLLAVPWDQFQQFALPEDEGGIPNFGKGAIKDIEECLAKHGFFCPPGTEWFHEQDTEEYIRLQAEQFLPGRKPAKNFKPR
jgi:hypothetical protein